MKLKILIKEKNGILHANYRLRNESLQKPMKPLETGGPATKNEASDDKITVQSEVTLRRCYLQG